MRTGKRGVKASLTAATLLFAGVLSAAGQSPTTTTRPPADTLPAFVASLETRQGESSERVALFSDGTVAWVVRQGPERTLQKKQISPEEKALLERVITEALTLSETSRTPSPLADRSLRRTVLEIASPGGEPRRFEFDDMMSLPLALGRARGALEELRDRFVDQVRAQKEKSWDPGSVKEGALLKRRTDQRLFRVVRDDRMTPLLELADEDRKLERLRIWRGDLPRIFEEPLLAPAGGDPP